MAQKIPKDKFDKMTKDYQKNNPGQTHAVRFDRASIEAILASNPKEIAVYFSEENKTKTVALIGIDSTDTLMYDTATNLGGLCPPNCPNP